MSHSESYHRLISSQRWVRLRMSYLSKHPLCERCLENGITRIAEEVHHVVPIESTRDLATQKALAYDITNLKALCKECHHDIHHGMHLHRSKAQTKAKAQSIAQQFIDTWLKKEDSTG